MQPVFAQTRTNSDSAINARKDAQEAARQTQQEQLARNREEQKRKVDSARASRTEITEQLKETRQERSDSILAVRKYRESKEYKDSVKEAREEKLAAIHEAQQARLDSMRQFRQHITDSTRQVRDKAMLALKKIQQHRSDSLNKIKVYRNSRRYTDSVSIARKNRLDSLHDIRQAFTDSILKVRKDNLARIKAARKITTDSLAAIRKVRTDSLAIVRKNKDAAMAKKKENKVRDDKIKQGNAEKKANILLELKIKKKRAVYTNESMLKKKWSAPRRGIQNTFTHYNYYFNANRKMEEAELNMQRTAKDNWDDRISLFDFDPRKDSARFSSDMDSVIQKTSLGIQIHDPRTKWGDDLYLLMGKAYYYKGNVENASNAFKYIVAMREKAKVDAAKKSAYSNRSVSGKKKEAPSIVTPEAKGIKEKLEHYPANNDALLWLTRTNTTYGRYSQSESLIDLLGADPKFPEGLQGQLALEKAYLALKLKNDKEAAIQLAVVSADKSIPVYMRRRAAFLDGQILQAAGDYTTAAEKYALVSDLNPKIDMDFYARRNRAYALMLSGGVQKNAIASLKSMLNDGKFRTYYEQVYYVLGRLSANSGNNEEAISYLKQGIAAPKSTKKQKAVSFAALGNIYFSTAEYALAKMAFDSVKHLSQYAPDDSGVAIASKRAAQVDKIAIPANVIHVQDSLLALGSLSEKAQRAVVRSYIRSLEKKMADSAFRAENSPGPGAAAAADPSADPNTMTWYFSSPTLVQEGITEFKRKWGNRPAVDNWRRSAALSNSGSSSVATSGSGTGSDTEGGAVSGLGENGLPTEEALMRFIPTTDEARGTATSRLQRAYLDMSTAYLRQFEDYTRSSAMLDTLENRWPGNPYAAEATYLRYLIALRRNNLKDAQMYSNKLRTDYSNSQYAEMVAPTAAVTEDQGGAPITISAYYENTYRLLQDRQYGEVLSRARNSRRQYPSDENYTNRFRIIEAMAFAGSAQYKQADTILNTFISSHPGDTLVPWAQEVLSFVSTKRKADTLKAAIPDSSNLAVTNPAQVADPMGSSTTQNLNTKPNIPVDTTGPVPTTYTYKPQEPHYFIFLANKMETRVMGVKAGINDLNKFTSSGDGLETDIVPISAGKVMIIVRSFKSAAAAKSYMAMFKAAKTLVREYQPDEFQTLIISARNYRKLAADGVTGSYLDFYRGHY